jgi:hypothetical protein
MALTGKYPILAPRYDKVAEGRGAGQEHVCTRSDGRCVHVRVESWALQSAGWARFSGPPISGARRRATRRRRYSVCDGDCMRLSTAAYWLSLADRDLLPMDEDSKQSVAVSVPKRNLLCVETLTALLSDDLGGATR